LLINSSCKGRVNDAMLQDNPLLFALLFSLFKVAFSFNTLFFHPANHSKLGGVLLEAIMSKAFVMIDIILSAWIDVAYIHLLLGTIMIRK